MTDTTIFPIKTASYRMFARCPRCDHHNIVHTGRFSGIKLPDIADRLICSACGKQGGAMLSPAPKIEVEV